MLFLCPKDFFPSIPSLNNSYLTFRSPLNRHFFQEAFFDLSLPRQVYLVPTQSTRPHAPQLLPGLEIVLSCKHGDGDPGQ